MEKEVWRDIPDCDGRYQASSLGRIRSAGFWPQKLRNGEVRIVHREPRILSLGQKRLGYLNADIGGKSQNVGRLVCAAFHGKPPHQGMQCAHLNGIPSDNRADNLTWATVSENQLHKRQHGTASKITLAQVIEIRRRRELGEAGPQLASEFKLHAETIYKIANGHYWPHVK